MTPAPSYWNASGIDVSIGAAGVHVRTESLVTLLAGGIAFDTSSFDVGTGPSPPDTTVTLFHDRVTAMKQPETAARRFVLYFNESLRGLSVAAPLPLLGLPAGRATSVGHDIHPK